MHSMMHTYEADNLIGLRIDDGRLEFIAVLGQGAEGDVLLARNVAPPGLSGIYQEELYVSFMSYLALSRLLARIYILGSSRFITLTFFVQCHVLCCIQAVKLVSKIGIGGRSFMNLQDEIALHQRACADGHPGILALHNVVDLPNSLYLITSFAPSGDLFERIVNPLRPRLCTQPETVRSIIVQLIDAVEYLHTEKGIAHRDIKPENLFWTEDGVQAGSGDMEAYDGIERGRLFIGDFGLATEDRFAADFGSGTSFYTSPEAAGYFRRIGLNGGNGNLMTAGGALLSPIHLMTDTKTGLAIPSPAEPGKTFEWENRISYDTFTSDIWSIGIVLINLICERNPWQCALQIDETFRAYAADPENTLIAVLPSLSEECHTMLKKVLKITPRERITLQEFKQEMLSINEFIRHSEEDILIEDAEQGHPSWLDVGPRESTPGSTSAASQGPSIGSTSGWLTVNSGSNTSQNEKSCTPQSSYKSTSGKSANSSQNGPITGASNNGQNNRPKRPLPVPLQIDPYRLSAALSGHVSASLASARYAAYARPGSAIPFPVQMPSTAPIIRLTSAQTQQQQQLQNHENGETKNNNVVKLKMPPTPAAMRARQMRLREESKVGTPTAAMRVDLVKNELSQSHPVEALVASVPCQLSLSGSTDQSSEAGVVTPVDQTGPYVALRGERGQSNRSQQYKEDGKGSEGGSDDQWLTIKPQYANPPVHQNYLNSQLGSGYPPVTPTEGQFSYNSAVPPLTPLLLTPTSGGRRYHPYGGNPHSGQAALINSPLRMAQQAFLDTHYGQNATRDGYLGPGSIGSMLQYSGGPRRGSVPETRMSGINNSRVNGGGADLMSRLAQDRKQ